MSDKLDLVFVSFRVARLDILLFVLDSFKFNAPMVVQFSSDLKPPVSVLDHLHLGFSLFLKEFCTIGYFDIRVDFLHLESIPSVRLVACLGVLDSIPLFCI